MEHHISVNVARNDIPYFSDRQLELIQINILLLPLQQYLAYTILFLTTQQEMQRRGLHSLRVQQLSYHVMRNNFSFSHAINS